MSSKEWGGFTDEDIQRIQANPLKISSFCNDSSCDIDGSRLTKQNRGPMKIKSSSKPITETEIECRLSKTGTNTIKTENQTTCKRKKTINESKLMKCSSENDIKTSDPESNNIKQLQYQLNGEKDAFLTTTDASDSLAVGNESNVLCENDSEPKCNLQSLEVFEQKQKRIEAENARRKALIIKTIMDKKKRTQAEVIKLAKVQKELNHLDGLLSSDVSILRNCIEKASMEFSEAEKRYLRAEKEFVEAKLLLFEKMQRKEQLTEHLCAIIEQNETRKANKLLELMKQLEMEAGSESHPDEIEPILSNLCILNDDAYHYQALKMSQQKKDQNHTSPEKTLSEEDTNSTPLQTDKEIEKSIEFDSPGKECDSLLKNKSDLNDAIERNGDE